MVAQQGFSLAQTVCALRALFIVSPHFVNKLTMCCFPGMIYCISFETSVRAKLSLCLTTAESRVKIWPFILIKQPPPPPWWLWLLFILRRWFCSCCFFHFLCCSHCLWGFNAWLSFVVSNCDFVTFSLVSWVGCGT